MPAHSNLCSIFLLYLLLVASFSGYSQNINYRAQGHYYSAKEKFLAKDYNAALGYVYKCKEALKGTNKELQYLHILSAFNSDKNQEAQKELEVFFQLDEGTLQPVRFDRSVETLTDDEIKSLTKLINKIDESVAADADARQKAEERKLAEQREAQMLKEQRANIYLINTGSYFLGMSRSQFETVARQKVQNYSTEDRVVKDYLANIQFEYRDNVFFFDNNFDLENDRYTKKYNNELRGVSTTLREKANEVSRDVSGLVPGHSRKWLNGILFDSRGSVQQIGYNFDVGGYSVADVPTKIYAMLKSKFGPPTTTKTNSDADGTTRLGEPEGSRYKMIYEQGGKKMLYVEMINKVHQLVPGDAGGGFQLTTDWTVNLTVYAKE